MITIVIVGLISYYILVIADSVASRGKIKEQRDMIEHLQNRLGVMVGRNEEIEKDRAHYVAMSASQSKRILELMDEATANAMRVAWLEGRYEPEKTDGNYATYTNEES